MLSLLFSSSKHKILARFDLSIKVTVPALIATGAGKVVKNLREKEGEVSLYLFYFFTFDSTFFTFLLFTLLFFTFLLFARKRRRGESLPFLLFTLLFLLFTLLFLLFYFLREKEEEASLYFFSTVS